MKRIILTAAASLVALATSGSAFAQASATASANGSTTIIRPITIAKTADLSFGRIVRPSSGSATITLANTSDVVTAGSGAVALSGITTSRAKFTIDGEGGQTISVSVPASFAMSNGTDSLTVTLSPDLGASTTLSGALASAGSAALNVGGSFPVADTTATGLYTGSFSVTVAYQ